MSGVEVCVVGSLNLDLVARVASLPRPGETVLAAGLSRHPGGKGLNQAIAAARAGAKVRMVGCVGVDEPGDWLVACLREGGVDVDGVQRAPDATTGQALISLSDEGENCIVVASGANLELASPSAAAATGARVVLAQLETALEPIASLFDTAPRGCTRILNAAPALPAGAALFEACDLLVVNETELAAYGAVAACPDAHEEIARLARRLMRRSEQAAVVTLGAAGALLVTARDAIHLPGHRAEVIDTVGAGDCFCGVLAATLAQHGTLASAVARANVAAALSVSRRGAADAMPTRDEILQAERAWGSAAPRAEPDPPSPTNGQEGLTR